MTIDERVAEVYVPNKEEMRANMASIAREDGRFDYPSRQAPEGYVTIRLAYRFADVHPSWLRTMLADGKFDRFNEPGLPAVIKNGRNAWAVRIDALQNYASGMRSTEPGDGTGGAGYKYEPQELKAVKRALSSCKTRGLSESTIGELTSLVEHLKADWAAGKLGKEPEGATASKPDPGADAAADAAAADADDEDLDFDFDEEDDD